MQRYFVLLSLIVGFTAVGSDNYFDPACPARVAMQAARFGEAQVASEWQSWNRDLFLKLVVPHMDGRNPYRMLPKGIPARLVAGFEALLSLSRDPAALFELLQEFEEEVVYIAEDQRLHADNTFLRVLEQDEQYFGFAKARVVTDFLDKKGFMELLAAGIPVADEYWFEKPHTQDGHRLKSILEARHIERVLGSRTLYLELYKFMGDVSALATLDWSETGIDLSGVRAGVLNSYPDIWAILEDTPFFTDERYNFEARDFTNPVFFASLRPLLPGLVGWK